MTLPESVGGSFDRRLARRAARGSFLLIAVWMAADWLALHVGLGPFAAALDLPFRFLCHRIPERVISVWDTPMPVCSRCAGIWLGLSISAAVAWPVLSLRVLRVVVPVAMALMLGEIVTQDLGWHPVFHPTRLLSGLLLSVPFGGAVGAMIDRELAG